LSAAFYLALLGHKVTVYEKAPNAGGMLRYALPEYRLPKSVVTKEIAFIRGAGVQFKFNVALGKQLVLDKLAQANDAVFVALGTWEEQALGLPGEDAKGVFSSLAFLNDAGFGRPRRLASGWW